MQVDVDLRSIHFGSRGLVLSSDVRGGICAKVSQKSLASRILYLTWKRARKKGSAKGIYVIDLGLWHAKHCVTFAVVASNSSGEDRGSETFAKRADGSQGAGCKAGFVCFG